MTILLGLGEFLGFVVRLWCCGRGKSGRSMVWSGNCGSGVLVLV